MNTLYDRGRYELLTAQMDWPTVSLELVAWSGVPSFIPTEMTPADIVARGYAVRGIALPIGGMAATANGTAQTDAIVVPDVAVGPDVTWLTMSRTGGALIMFIDDAEGLPFEPNGLDLVLQPDWITARGWFRP